MSVLILHLSDIHLHSPQDHILKRAEAISATLNPSLPEATVLLVVISGDIAQSGQSAEYKLAHQLLDDVLKKVRREKKIPTHFIVAAGNHDCDFSGDQEARLAVVASIPRKSGAIPESYLTATTKVQKEFFAFRRKMESRDLVHLDDKLWTSYVINVDGLKIAIDALNASWMSTNPEQQGGLVFPFERYASQSPLDFDLRIGVLHHPINWYNQSNYLAFRSFIHRLEDVILTGHEHQSAGRFIEDADDGECVYVEGAALQPRNSTSSGFNILTVDPTTKQFRYERFALTGGRYEPINSRGWIAFRALPKRSRPELSLADAFRCELQDPGATLKHPTGRELTLDDIFVFPDLLDKSGMAEDLDARGNAKMNSSHLSDLSQLTHDILIQGDNESGKTRLLYKLLDSYHLQGNLPLLLRGKQIKSAGSQDIHRMLDAAIEDQYGKDNKQCYLQAATDKKILLLDDLDLCPLNQERKSKLIVDLKKRFHRLVATVGESFEIKELIGADELFELTTFRHYEIRPLGYVKRLELIKKWHRIGGLETQSTNDFLRLCDDAVQLIESTKLQHVASTVPIFVLSLLQATSSSLANEAQNSSFAHYYYFLVVGALDKAGVAKSDLGVYLAVCTHLSWFIRTHGVDQRISRRQLKLFVSDYSRDWTATDEAKLLDVLLKSRLMNQSGDTLQFTCIHVLLFSRSLCSHPDCFKGG